MTIPTSTQSLHMIDHTGDGMPEAPLHAFQDLYGTAPTVSIRTDVRGPLSVDLLRAIIKVLNLGDVPDVADGEVFKYTDLLELLNRPDEDVRMRLVQSSVTPHYSRGERSKRREGDTRIMLYADDDAGDAVVRITTPYLAALTPGAAVEHATDDPLTEIMASGHCARTLQALMDAVASADAIKPTITGGVGAGEVSIIVNHPQRGLQLVECAIKAQPMVNGTQIASEYNMLSDLIGDQIDDRGRGLILLHGVPGTGKTSFIRHLIANYPERQFVIMPPEIFESAGTPNFLRFMLQQCQDAVLIIEDAERILTKRAEADSSIGISTLLNMGDGLMSDVLTSPIICTFNMEVRNIDQAVLRSGRLIKRHEFKALNRTDVELILANAGLEYTGQIGNGVSIADVYQAINLLKMGDYESRANADTLLMKMTSAFGFNQN